MNRVLLLLLTMLMLAVAPGLAQGEMERDPFRFGNGNESPPKKVDRDKLLTLILVSKGEKLAIIGGRAVKLGEKIGGGVVTDITINGVTADIAGVIKVYPLGKELKK